MDKQFSVCASLGRIHDPLLQLARRIHRKLLTNDKVVWMGNNGYVFATPTDLLRSMPPHTIIGVYTNLTPAPIIEMALRYALRERASAWIVDWQAAYSLNSRSTDNHVLQFTTPRKRKTTHAEPRAVTPNVRQRTDATLLHF